MAAILYQYPALYIDEASKSPDVRKFAANTGHTGTTVIQPADLVVYSSPGINRCATNAATLSGLSVYSEQSIFGPYSGNTAVGPQSVFGWVSNPGAGLLPDDTTGIAVNSLTGSILVEMSLISTCGWITGGTQQANINTQVGIVLDATTNLFVADPSQSNKVAVIKAKAEGPYNYLQSGQIVGKGFAGDTGARVLVSFLSTVLT